MTKIGKKLAAVFLTFAMVVTFMPVVGTQAAYAEDAVEISGEVDASTLAFGGNYVLTGDTTINVDVSNMLGTINIGASNLTITGEEGEILSTTGITGSAGKLYLKSASLDVDTSASTGNYPTAIDLPNGEVHIEGGGLFLNFTSNGTGASTSYGINCANFFMTEGSATITCTAVNSGNAVGLSCDHFEMYGGSMGIEGTSQVSGKSGYGISNRGSGSVGDFYMAGGGLRVEGNSLSEGYGIDWSAASSNSVTIEGGTLEATGQFTALRSWCNVLFSGGAQVTLKATDAIGVSIDGGSLTVQGIGTKLTVNTGEGTAVAVYDGGINLLEGAAVLTPEGGEVKDAGTMTTIANGSGNTAGNVVIESLTIPTELALTYDTSKAFPTTRLTGRDVSMYFLNNITSNPGFEHANDGWYVHGAYPEKTYPGTDRYTCLVEKVDGEYIKLYDSVEPLDASGEYYFCFNIEDNQTRPFNTAETYTATVNGEPADYVRQPEASNGELYVYKRVYLDETTNVIWGVNVTPRDSKVTKGGSRQFTAEAVGATNKNVTWSVSGNSSAGTYITPEGVLYAGNDENQTWIQVTATSVIDSTISNTADVNIVDYIPNIDSVTVTAERDFICRGTSMWVEAEVEGSDLHDLTWEVIGSDGSSHLSGGANLDRVLEVGSDETATELTIRATSVADPTKYGEVTLRVEDKKAVTGPVAINFDDSAVSLTDESGNLKTGKQVTKEFRNAITTVYGQDVADADAPGGWYVYGEDRSIDPTSRYTSLVREMDGYNFDETLYQSTDALSADGEYYLWFNLEVCTNTHKIDNSKDVEDLGITVNGMPVNGETVIAKWGGAIEVYVKIVEEPGWVLIGDHWYYYESNTTFATEKWMKKDGEWAYLGKDGRAEFKARDIKDASVTGLSDKTYTGKAITQTPVVTLDSTTLEPETDYTVAYENNTNAGTATVVITGKGNYTGTVEKTFEITPKKITPTVTLSASSYTWNGKVKKPTVTVKDGSTKLTASDYTVTWPSDVTNAGTKTVKVTLTGNYSGSKSVTYTIKPKAITPTVTLSTTAYTWNGKVKKPTVTVKDGSTKLAASQYTVTYASGRKNVGKYSVKVALKGNYSGSKTVSFKINPKGTTMKYASTFTVGKTAATVKWNKQANKMSSYRVTGYVVQIATDSAFTQNKKSVTVTGYGKESVQLKGLKSNKTYYVRVCTYRKISTGNSAGTYYSPWSAARTFKTKK